MALILTASLVFIACVAITLSLAFAYHRGVHAKSLIAKCWSLRRRQVLHLDALNGFDLLREKLHEWSLFVSRAAIGSLVLVHIWQPDQIVLAIALVTSTFAYLYVVRFHVATTRRDQADLPFEFDGFGTYARASASWENERSEAKPIAIWTIVAALIFWIFYIQQLKALESSRPAGATHHTHASISQR